MFVVGLLLSVVCRLSFVSVVCLVLLVVGCWLWVVCSSLLFLAWCFLFDGVRCLWFVD